jgi:hypothetical protein
MPDDQVEQAAAKALGLHFWQQCQHDDLARSGVTEAVANEPALDTADISRQCARSNVCTPAGSRDTYLAQPGFGYSVLARTAPQINTLRSVAADGRCQLQKCRQHGSTFRHHDFPR